jgi:cation diffusion facilitator CzcD-associated flavoprotein CzcO
LDRLSDNAEDAHLVNNWETGTAVIGGSQAGLAVGYHLRRRGLPFVILDDNERIGDAWRIRGRSPRAPGAFPIT